MINLARELLFHSFRFCSISSFSHESQGLEAYENAVFSVTQQEAILDSTFNRCKQAQHLISICFYD